MWCNAHKECYVIIFIEPTDLENARTISPKQRSKVANAMFDHADLEWLLYNLSNSFKLRRNLALLADSTDKFWSVSLLCLSSHSCPRELMRCFIFLHRRFNAFCFSFAALLLFALLLLTIVTGTSRICAILKRWSSSRDGSRLSCAFRTASRCVFPFKWLRRWTSLDIYKIQNAIT